MLKDAAAIVGISQSGQSPDLLSVIEARPHLLFTIATNGTRMSRELARRLSKLGNVLLLVEAMIDDSFVGDDIYFDMDSGSIGLLGFMEGQEPASGVPESIIPQVQEMLAAMQAGEMDRFDIFTGPINP